MSDTPRTDKAEAFDDDGRMVSASFARTLERELAAAVKERDEAMSNASRANCRAEAEYAEHMAFANAACERDQRAHETAIRRNRVIRRLLRRCKRRLAERDEARACLREACECYEADADRVAAHIRGPEPMKRWRKAAGIDAGA